jgi:hypothetical protein
MLSIIHSIDDPIGHGDFAFFQLVKLKLNSDVLWNAEMKSPVSARASTSIAASSGRLAFVSRKCA